MEKIVQEINLANFLNGKTGEDINLDNFLSGEIGQRAFG